MSERENEFEGGRMSCPQKFCLLEFMENHPDLIKSKFTNYEEKKSAEALWEQLSTQLNSLEGPKKSAVKWKRTWVQLKHKCKKRNSEIKVSRNGVALTLLSNLDRRAVALINSNVVSHPDALQIVEPKQVNEHDYCIYDEAHTKVSITENEINEKNTCSDISTTEKNIHCSENVTPGETTVGSSAKSDQDQEFNRSINNIVYYMGEKNAILKDLLQERKEANALLRLEIQERKETNLLFKELLNVLRNK